MNKAEHLMVCDTKNNRIQLLKLKGNLFTNIGKRGTRIGGIIVSLLIVSCVCRLELMAECNILMAILKSFIKPTEFGFQLSSFATPMQFYI